MVMDNVGYRSDAGQNMLTLRRDPRRWPGHGPGARPELPGRG